MLLSWVKDLASVTNSAKHSEKSSTLSSNINNTAHFYVPNSTLESGKIKYEIVLIEQIMWTKSILYVLGTDFFNFT